MLCNKLGSRIIGPRNVVLRIGFVMFGRGCLSCLFICIGMVQAMGPFVHALLFCGMPEPSLQKHNNAPELNPFHYCRKPYQSSLPSEYMSFIICVAQRAINVSSSQLHGRADAPPAIDGNELFVCAGATQLASQSAAGAPAL